MKQTHQWLAEQIVEKARDAILVADREGVIRLWNSGAEAIFGYSKDEAIGQTLDLIVPERFRERHWEGYHRVMATGDTKYGTELLAVPGARSDGSRISIEFTITLLTESDGSVLGASAIVRDVSQRWQQERAVREHVAELEARLADLTPRA